MPKKKEPTYVQDSARDPEDAWIFDSLVGFLRGPVWHVPVMSFIEQKSLSKYFYIKLKYISATTLPADLFGVMGHFT